jgi:hypothetical protein
MIFSEEVNRKAGRRLEKEKSPTALPTTSSAARLFWNCHGQITTTTQNSAALSRNTASARRAPSAGSV